MRHEITERMKPDELIPTVYNESLPAWLWAELVAWKQNAGDNEPWRAAAVEKDEKTGSIYITAEMPAWWPKDE